MNSIRQGTMLAAYKILEPMPGGRGGMAQVYLAQNTLVEKEPCLVAIKVAHTSTQSTKSQADADDVFDAAIHNEAAILKQLRHPNIIHIYPISGAIPQNPYIARAIQIVGEPWYFVMEYLQGPTLEAFIKERRKLTVTESVEVAFQIGMALDFMHNKNYAHLDLKPTNVLFRYQPGMDLASFEPVLIDFGIAAGNKSPILDAGSVPYLSPERLRLLKGNLAPEQVTDQRPADVYQLGMLLYKMVTGYLPFQGTNERITTAVYNDPPTRPREFNRQLPPRLETLILRALEKEPQNRPKIEEMVTELDVITSPPRLWSPASGSQASSKSGSKRGFKPAVIGLSAVFAIVLIGVHFRRIDSLIDPTSTPSLSPAPTCAVCITDTTPANRIPSLTPSLPPAPTSVSILHPTNTSTSTPTNLRGPTPTTAPVKTPTPTFTPTPTPPR